MEELSFNQDYANNRNSFSDRNALVKEDEDV